MFDLSPEKILALGVIALIVLGPERLPIFARKAGRVVSELRRMSGSFQDEVRGALVEPRQAINDAAKEMGLPGLTGVSGIPRVPSVRRALTDTIMGGNDKGSATEASASANQVPSVQAGGHPPVPDDPTLN